MAIKIIIGYFIFLYGTAIIMVIRERIENNGVTAVLGINGQLTLFDDENGNEIDDMWVTDIPEVKERILKGE